MVWAPESKGVGGALELLSHGLAVLKWLAESMPAWLVVYFLGKTHLKASDVKRQAMDWVWGWVWQRW